MEKKTKPYVPRTRASIKYDAQQKRKRTRDKWIGLAVLGTLALSLFWYGATGLWHLWTIMTVQMFLNLLASLVCLVLALALMFDQNEKRKSSGVSQFFMLAAGLGSVGFLMNAWP